jgi:hypothetical protein
MLMEFGGRCRAEKRYREVSKVGKSIVETRGVDITQQEL